MNVEALAPFTNAECPSCGKHTRVKREFGPYTVVRRLAAGGMSMVFVAQDNTLDREVALKILSEDYSADEKRIAAFEEEARITASFSHPNVVRVLRTGKAFGRFYIAMELVPGGHFEHHIRERGKIPEAEMLPLAIEVAQGLKAAHAAGLIHRDVKPGNILLDAEGHAKLVDFGLSLVTQGGKAKAAELWATPYYVPPETIEGFPEDFRSDIYAFGATLYHALAGVPSCGEETMATDVLREAKRRVVPLGKAEPTLSAGICEIVERSMAYDPDQRFSSYDELISRLESARKRLMAGGGGAVESSGSAAKRRARTKREERLTLAGAALLVVAAVSGGVWWVTREDPAAKLKKPIAAIPSPIIPEATSEGASDIAKSYSAARAAVEARDFAKAAEGFVKLRDNPEVQEPTRSWAGVEAVVATYLDGRAADARNEAKSSADHAQSVAEGMRLNDGLVKMLAKLPRLPAIPAKEMDSSASDAAHVMQWMLAGLKNWEQGMTDEAGAWFSAVSSAKLASDDGWLAVYQNLAKDYLADRGALGSPVFNALPSDVAGCETAVAELDKILATLKTRGRAKFNVRAWQLDLTKHEKLLKSPPKIEPAEPIVSEFDQWEMVEIMAKLGELAKECRFSEASAQLKSMASDPAGATRASLLSIADSSAVFLTDLEADLAREPVSGEFPMKSGDVARKISRGPQGVLTVTNAAGTTRSARWADFSPDALIALHRMFVKNPKSEAERLRRHECAISFDWLAGNRERALSAAATLSQSSPEFKKHWETIASGLPE